MKERRRDFFTKQVLWFFVLFPKDNKILFELSLGHNIGIRAQHFANQLRNNRKSGAIFGNIQTKFDRMEIGINHKLQEIKATICRIRHPNNYA